MWNCATLPPDLYLGRLRWSDHAPRRPEDELTKDLFAHAATYVALAEGMGNHAQGRPVIPHRAAGIRVRTMEKGLRENFQPDRTGPNQLAA